MYSTCLEREYNGCYEVINISDYGFEWYKDNELVKTGLIEDKDSDIEMLKEEGFVIVE